MAAPRPALPAVVCHDRPAVAASVAELLRRTGFEVAACTESLPVLTRAISTTSARLAVLALPLTGMRGLSAIRELTSAAPDCQLVLLEAPDTLNLAALEAGARATVPDDDLRRLRVVLLEIAAEQRVVALPEARPHDEATGSVSTNPSS
jgi:CheY-like chemotaxis protein